MDLCESPCLIISSFPPQSCLLRLREGIIPAHSSGSGRGIQCVGRCTSSPEALSNQVLSARTAIVHSPRVGQYRNTGSVECGAVSIGNAIGRRSETPGNSTLLSTLLVLDFMSLARRAGNQPHSN
jgi:hypothetical protein